MLILVIPILVYLLSFSSIIYNEQFIEEKLEESGRFFYSQEINSQVISYLASPDETKLISLDVFNERERQHLLDVKVLVHNAFDFLFLLLVFFFVLVCYNHKLNKGRNWGQILVYSGMITAGLPVFLYFMPFEFLFAAFHSVFFAGKSWIFAQGSALTEVYPIEFWQSVSFSLFLRSAAAGWILILAGMYSLRKKLPVV